MSKWRFYGRESELEEITETLRLREDTRSFGSIRILGRRGVGKPHSCGKPLRDPRTARRFCTSNCQPPDKGDVQHPAA